MMPKAAVTTAPTTPPTMARVLVVPLSGLLVAPFPGLLVVSVGVLVGALLSVAPVVALVVVLREAGGEIYVQEISLEGSTSQKILYPRLK